MDDVRRVLSVSYDAASVADRQKRVAVVTQSLAALIPAEIVGWAELGMIRGAGTTLLTGAGPEQPTVTARVARFAQQHPIGRLLQLHPTSVAPVRLSDVIWGPEWRRDPVFTEVFKPLGIVHQVGIPIPPYRSGRVQAWALSRSGDDFPDELLELAGHLQPLLAALNTLERVTTPIPVGVDLTDREAQILESIASGLTARQIAWVLRLSVSTVNTHTEHLYSKLGVHDRVSAVRRAAELRARVPS